MVNFPTWIPDCDFHSPVLLDLFISSDASNCSAIALGNYDHVVSYSMDFLSNSKGDTPFYCIVYDYSFADWNSFCDHLRDVLWENIFKLDASTAACEFCE